MPKDDTSEFKPLTPNAEMADRVARLGVDRAMLIRMAVMTRRMCSLPQTATERDQETLEKMSALFRAVYGKE